MNMIVIWNAIVFFIYGFDKSQSKMRKWRISEDILILCAAMLGGIGALFGMMLFRHKTRKMKFKIFIPIFVVMELIVLYYILKQ